MKSHFSRRHFLTTLGAGIVAFQVVPLQACSSSGSSSAYNGESTDYWIDRRFMTFKTPWRKVHLDFHNSKHIPQIGAKFDAQEWGDRLVTGNLNSIVVFAKDMHGYFYYPSKHGPVHPGLSVDLLGEQVKVCRERNIAVYAYLLYNMGSLPGQQASGMEYAKSRRF